MKSNYAFFELIVKRLTTSPKHLDLPSLRRRIGEENINGEYLNKLGGESEVGTEPFLEEENR